MKKEGRIDKYLSNELDESRATIIKMINKGYILVNSKIVKPSFSLKESDNIEIKSGFKEEQNIEPEEMNLNIVYEDDDLMVIDKPSGLVVHPGSGNYQHTLLNGLMAYTNKLSNINGEKRLGIVHRIDKDTSGLMIVAKNNKTHQLLATDFKNKSIKREYRALIHGAFPHETATIDAPIGRDPFNRQRMTVIEKNSKSAITELKVLKRYEKYTLISLLLKTGRTHQIRVHMNYIGYPIYNDPMYSQDSCTDFGQFLHSYSLSFIHPITKEELSFTSPLPKAFQSFLDTLEEENYN